MNPSTEAAPPVATPTVPPGRRCDQPFRLRDFLRDVARLVAVNTAIALVLTALAGGYFLYQWLYSNCIGFSIFLLANWLGYRLREPIPGLRVLLVAVPAGTVIGLTVASLVAGDRLLAVAVANPAVLVGVLAMAGSIGSVASYYFHARARMAEQQSQLQAEKAARSAADRDLADARLRALQAQIEPHFLFNTLSTVVGLVDERPEDAKRMLVDLTRLLRRSLQRSRADQRTIADEAEDLRAYLGIQALRLGARLRYDIEIEPGLSAVRIAPYLVQPLVENAIVHGIEPSVEGGAVRVRFARAAGTLVIEVSDTGLGLRADHPPGMALANIRDRLHGQHGAAATLALHPALPHGVVARIELPLAGDGGAA